MEFGLLHRLGEAPLLQLLFLASKLVAPAEKFRRSSWGSPWVLPDVTLKNFRSIQELCWVYLGMNDFGSPFWDKPISTRVWTLPCRPLNVKIIFASKHVNLTAAHGGIPCKRLIHCAARRKRFQIVAESSVRKKQPWGVP